MSVQEFKKYVCGHLITTVLQLICYLITKYKGNFSEMFVYIMWYVMLKKYISWYILTEYFILSNTDIDMLTLKPFKALIR